MANCLITLSGITTDCSPSLGGIKEVYIANYEDVTDVTETDGIITSITTSATGKFHKFEFRKGTGSMTSTLNVDETAGTNYVSTECALVFTKMDTAKRIEIAALSVGHLRIIVRDANGTLWFLGKNDYVSASAGSANSGTAKGDSNNYSITFTDESNSYPFEVAEEALKTIVA